MGLLSTRAWAWMSCAAGSRTEELSATVTLEEKLRRFHWAEHEKIEQDRPYFFSEGAIIADIVVVVISNLLLLVISPLFKPLSLVTSLLQCWGLLAQGLLVMSQSAEQTEQVLNWGREKLWRYLEKWGPFFLRELCLLSLAKWRLLCDIVLPINISKEHLLQQAENLSI